jgi:preprotein translocase subunit SecE
MMASKTEKESKRADKAPDTSAKTFAKPAKNQSKQAKEQPKGQKNVKKDVKKAPKKDNIFRKALTYFHNVRLEIKRATWPTRPEVLNMSLVVVGALLFFGVVIFLLDWAMTELLVLYSSLGPTT